MLSNLKGLPKGSPSFKSDANILLLFYPEVACFIVVLSRGGKLAAEFRFCSEDSGGS